MVSTYEYPEYMKARIDIINVKLEIVMPAKLLTPKKYWRTKHYPESKSMYQ